MEVVKSEAHYKKLKLAKAQKGDIAQAIKPYELDPQTLSLLFQRIEQSSWISATRAYHRNIKLQQLRGKDQLKKNEAKRTRWYRRKKLEELSKHLKKAKVILDDLAEGGMILRDIDQSFFDSTSDPMLLQHGEFLRDQALQQYANQEVPWEEFNAVELISGIHDTITKLEKAVELQRQNYEGRSKERRPKASEHEYLIRELAFFFKNHVPGIEISSSVDSPFSKLVSHVLDNLLDQDIGDPKAHIDNVKKKYGIE